jgi:Arc/MetJ family transcription regulator
VKTTIEIDEEKLLRVMELTGIATRREAVDFALSEAERLAKMTEVLRVPWTEEEMAGAIDPAYDLMKLREMEKPSNADSR